MVDARDKQIFFFLEPAGQDLHSFIPIQKEKKSALEVFKTPVVLAWLSLSLIPCFFDNGSD